MPLNLPNLLTALRVLAIPLMVVCYYLPQPISTVGAAVVFIIAAVTDWFDGWVARRMGQTSQFGAFLDPVADKLLVSVALILLLHRMDNVFITLAAMVVIGREIVVSALREWMAQLGKRASVAVSGMAKVKTGVQMTAIPILLWYPSEPAGETLRLLGLFLLALAVVLTLWSMVLYFRAFLASLDDAPASTDS
ncbi:MAG: CDP-diacylglycerol--glycerol-3-phosphate 3-phosphatidyltransferase [Luminiphilus sp.]|nr:CDP-diacylglycerol--glycerol-3-phosphate 3-phosphatidyltransferase [Luminiphilus sp.]